MGMYTQVRGWINIDSIGYGRFEKLEKIFNEVNKEYIENRKTPRCEFIMQDTHIMQGSNGSAFIFIGSELKNYNNDAEEYIKFLANKFHNAEGHVCFQYEDDECFNKTWIISKGKIEEKHQQFPFKGYGNMF